MTDKEEKIIQYAFNWVKKNKNFIKARFCSSNDISPDDIPTTIFMAGCPGAGKTEFSLNLADKFNQKPVIIDADEIRKIVPKYRGDKAYLYQKAANKGVNILYDYSCKMNFNVILDGTFAYGDAEGNIEHSLKHNRNIEIYFIYQDPLLSWELTKIREKKEFRNVPKDVFISAYLDSMKNIKLVKKIFGNKIKLNIVIKDFNKGLNKFELNKDKLEGYIGKLYNKGELEALLA